MTMQDQNDALTSNTISVLGARELFQICLSQTSHQTLCLKWNKTKTISDPIRPVNAQRDYGDKFEHLDKPP